MNPAEPVDVEPPNVAGRGGDVGAARVFGLQAALYRRHAQASWSWRCRSAHAPRGSFTVNFTVTPEANAPLFRTVAVSVNCAPLVVADQAQREIGRPLSAAEASAWVLAWSSASESTLSPTSNRAGRRSSCASRRTSRPWNPWRRAAALLPALLTLRHQPRE